MNSHKDILWHIAKPKSNKNIGSTRCKNEREDKRIALTPDYIPKNQKGLQCNQCIEDYARNL